jgi:hypothetical protein
VKLYVGLKEKQNPQSLRVKKNLARKRTLNTILFMDLFKSKEDAEKYFKAIDCRVACGKVNPSDY